MTDGISDEFTVSDLVRGWDDMRQLLAADPDRVWEVVSSWPQRRLATALVAAVMVLWPDNSTATEERLAGAHIAAGGRRSPVGDGGRLAGHVAVPEWPR